jgi:shikimate dehydrogenase
MLRSGLIGRSILASRSPWLHEQEARAQGMELSYELFDFDARRLADSALEPLLSELVERGFSGFNVTYPFKQAIIALLDRLDASAEMVAAVNTVAIGDGVLTGHNTDMAGFRDSMVAGLPGADLDRVLQIGAGGAGSAVAAALLSLGVQQLEIADLDVSRAEGLIERLARNHPNASLVARSVEGLGPTGYTGIVNSSPVGMAKTPGSPISTDGLRPEQWVADIVYFPFETELLRGARRRGCRTLDGSGMVVGQAALAFEIITGVPADLPRVRGSFLGPANPVANSPEDQFCNAKERR